MLRQNESHNQAVQGQGLTENQHNERSDVELVGRLGTRSSRHHIVAAAIGTLEGGIVVKLAAVLSLEAESADTRVSENSNGSTSRQAGETAAETGKQL